MWHSHFLSRLSLITNVSQCGALTYPYNLREGGRERNRRRMRDVEEMNDTHIYLRIVLYGRLHHKNEYKTLVERKKERKKKENRMKRS